MARKPDKGSQEHLNQLLKEAKERRQFGNRKENRRRQKRLSDHSDLLPAEQHHLPPFSFDWLHLVWMLMFVTFFLWVGKEYIHHWSRDFVPRRSWIGIAVNFASILGFSMFTTAWLFMHMRWVVPFTPAISAVLSLTLVGIGGLGLNKLLPMTLRLYDIMTLEDLVIVVLALLLITALCFLPVWFATRVYKGFRPWRKKGFRWFPYLGQVIAFTFFVSLGDELLFDLFSEVLPRGGVLSMLLLWLCCFIFPLWAIVRCFPTRFAFAKFLPSLSIILYELLDERINVFRFIHRLRPGLDNLEDTALFVVYLGLLIVLAMVTLKILSPLLGKKFRRHQVTT